MKLFFSDFSNNNSICDKTPLDSSVWQALDIFKNLPENDGSYLGLIDKSGRVIYFSKYDKYFWAVDIQIMGKKMAYIGFFTRDRCIYIIKELFNEKSPLDISGLSFKKYL